MRLNGISSSKVFRECELKKGFVRGKNIIFTEDAIASRPGITLLENPVVFDPEAFSSGLAEFKITSCRINIDGRMHRIAVTVDDDGYSNVYYNICALSGTGKTELGTITFTRSSYESFVLPDSFIVFEGQPTVGSGIYFLADISTTDPVNGYRLLELAEDRSRWIYVSDSEIYTPTLLRNGRGGASVKALSEGIRLSAEHYPEGMNMLSKKYHAGYTTDGYSSYYKLPKAPIVGKIESKLTLDSGAVISFIINDDEITSQSVEIAGARMHLRCDRERGYISTDSDTKLSVPLPFMGLENNLVFTVYMAENPDLNRVCSLTECRRIFADSAAVSSGVTVFSGSRDYPEDIVWNSPLNPLYFPEQNRLSLPSPIIKLSEVSKNLVIFEKESFCSAKATIKPAEVKGFQNTIQLSLSPKSKLFREILPETVAESVGKLYFSATNGEVYSVDSALNLKKEAELSLCLPNRGIMFFERYLLVSKNQVFLLDPENPLKELIPWEMPTEILATIDFNGKTVFYSENRVGQLLAYTLSGDSDNFSLEALPIECEFSALLLDEPRRFRLYELSASGEVEAFRLSLISDEKPIGSFVVNAGAKKLSLSSPFSSLVGEFKFFGGAKFKKAKLKYSRFSRL